MLSPTKLLAYSLILVGMISSSSADNKNTYRLIMKGVVENYRAAEKLKICMNTAIETETLDGKVKKQNTSITIYALGDRYRYESGKSTFLKNRNVMLYVDELTRVIYFKINPSALSMKDYAGKYTTAQWLNSIDSALQNCPALQYSSKSGIHNFSGDLSKGPYKKFEVTFLGDSIIRDMCYQYRQSGNTKSGKVCTYFKEVDFAPVFAKNLFDETPFLKVIGKGKVNVAEKYRSFEILEL